MIRQIKCCVVFMQWFVGKCAAYSYTSAATRTDKVPSRQWTLVSGAAPRPLATFLSAARHPQCCREKLRNRTASRGQGTGQRQCRGRSFLNLAQFAPASLFSVHLDPRRWRPFAHLPCPPDEPIISLAWVASSARDGVSRYVFGSRLDKRSHF